MFRVIYFVLTAFAAICNAEVFETAPRAGNRIVGGSDASIYDFPHQVSIHYKGIHRCGGSIYSETIIITSHAWIYGTDILELRVVAGITLLSEPKIEIPIQNRIIHPQYSSVTGDNDVAILVLSRPLQFGPGIQPIPLAKVRPPVGTVATVTGWGSLDGNHVYYDQLQKVDVIVMSKLDCIKYLLFFFYDPSKLCAGVPEGGKDSCWGDEGGPLIVKNELLGIVSQYSSSCGAPGSPGVYASVPDLYNWIVQTAEKNTISFEEA